MLNRELIQKEYDFLKDEIFLNVSSVVMPPKRVQAKYNSFMNEYIENYGDDIVPKSWQIVEETRKKIAQLIHAQDPLEIGFVKNTCKGVSILADGYPFKQGDNVVLCNQEHQANLFPWINVHQRKGVELKVVHAKDNEINADDLISQIDEHTRILTISSIQFSTGFYADLKKLGQACTNYSTLCFLSKCGITCIASEYHH